MNNMMQMMMQMMNGGKFNPQQMMGIFGGNPMFQQAQKMMQGNNNPLETIMNVAKQKGISEDELKKMAQQFNIKL